MEDNNYNPVLLPFVMQVQDAVPDAKLSYADVIAIMKVICAIGQIYETDICPLVNA